MLSVIIPTYNRNDLLAQCLHRLDPQYQTTDIDYEVIVTDDSKVQSAKEFIATNFDWACWVQGPQKGPSGNRNNGARQAKGEWLVFLDDDCLPDQDLLNSYLKAIADYPTIQVFEGCIMADRPQRNFAEESPVNETGGYLWSCNFMIHKDLFLNKLTGFDENFPYAAMEDVELNYRLKKLQADKIFLKDAFVIHPWRLQKNMWQITINRFKSTLYFLKKHPEKKKEINPKYYLIAFYNSLKKTVYFAVQFKFKGLGQKIIYDFLQLYFALYTLVSKY